MDIRNAKRKDGGAVQGSLSLCLYSHIFGNREVNVEFYN